MKCDWMKRERNKWTRENETGVLMRPSVSIANHECLEIHRVLCKETRQRVSEREKEKNEMK